jgi:hypothetical protein
VADFIGFRWLKRLALFVSGVSPILHGRPFCRRLQPYPEYWNI